MKKFGFVGGLLLLLLSPISSASEPVTLEKYLEEVRGANPAIRSSLLRVRALEHRVRPAGTPDDPFIAVGVDQIAFDGSPGSVRRYQVSQTIPFPGKLGTKLDIAENKAKSAASDSETIAREITVLATQAFYRAYFNHRALELNEKLRKLIEGTVASTKSKYQTGETGHHDWLLAKVELNVSDVERLRLRREETALFAILNELRDMPVGTPLGILKADFTGQKFEEESDPLRAQPELKSLEYLAAQSEREEKLARLSYWPDLVVQGMAMQPSHDMMNEKSNWGVMVGVSLPIFFWRKQSDLSRAAAIDREAITMERRNFENRLNSELVDARQELTTASDVVKLYRDAVIPTTSLAMQNAKSGYAARRLPISQFLETIRIQRTQELEYLAAQIDVELARTRLRHLLSSPPRLRLAPTKPSLFGGGSMGGSAASAMGSDTVNMGRGMSGPTRKAQELQPSQSGPGMGNM